jgi:hypothetical protein
MQTVYLLAIEKNILRWLVYLASKEQWQCTKFTVVFGSQSHFLKGVGHAFRWQINKDDFNLLFSYFYLKVPFNDNTSVPNIFFPFLTQLLQRTVGLGL